MQFTQDEFITLIRKVSQPNRQKWAIENGVDPAHLSRVLNGRDDPRPKLIDAVGFERLTIYKRKAK